MKAGALAFALTLAAVGCSGQRLPTAAPALPPGVTVGPNVQVSLRYKGLAHGEALIAADPVNPQHLIACSGVWTTPSGPFPHNGIREVAYVSEDGGGSWSATKLTHVGAFDLDPVCAIGLGGVAYFGGASAFDPEPGHDWIARSTDGGMHWQAPSLFPWGDRDFIAVDTTTSRYRGRLYDVALNAKHAPGGDIANLGMIRSTDNGKTFLPSVRVFTNPRGGVPTYFSAPITILRNGDVVTLGYGWPNSSKAKPLAVFVSKDGGETFSPPRVVTTRTGSALIGIASFKEEGASVLPVLASDDTTGPFRNRIYVVWQDFSKRAYGSAFQSLQAAIMISYSDDEGKNWSTPTEVDDAPSEPSRQYPIVFAPCLAVNDKGIVAVTWFDGRSESDGAGGTLRMAVSNDGAETFSPSFAVASAPTLVVPDANRVTLEMSGSVGETHFVTDLRYHVFGQDTQGLAADASGAFHPLWVDNRTGTAQLWTDGVSVDERAVLHGDASLSRLRDVSKSVALEYFGATYDRTTHVLTTAAALINTSHHPIEGPVRIRVTSLWSEVGRAAFESAGGAATGVGTVLTFVPEKGTVFAPKARSKRVRIVFRIDDAHAATSDDVVGGAINYAVITFKAYAAGGARH
ncbi:MAG: sialidase family protein [Candidatus Tyrphobacter sp.]